jgi:glycosyltransferase involved in cell wall biosynthesis
VSGRIAYLNSEYPSLSHTFIEREVSGLRALGIPIRTFSVRTPSELARVGSAHEAAAADTTVLLAGSARIFRDAAWGACRSPIGVVRALVRGQKIAPPGLASRVRHLAYVCEGIRLARELSKEQIRHIHVHMANNGAAIAMMACAFDRALTYSLSIHGSAEFFHVDSWTLREKAEQARFVRCISEFCRAQVMAWTAPTAWSNFHVVHCGVDPSVYQPRPPRLPGPVRFLTVGRMHPIKGYHQLLQACRELSQRGLAWRMRMVGDGPERESLQRSARELRLADAIEFTGPVSQDAIQQHYDWADAMVMSSFMEGVPVVLMEAMAKQLGVIAPRVGGIPELVSEGVHGLLVPPGSIADLADAMSVLAENPALAGEHGTAGRRRVIESFSIDGLTRGMAGLFAKYAVLGPAETGP